MWLTEVGAPVTSSDWDDGELGDDDGGADGCGDFLGGLDAETDVAGRVTDDNDGLEAGALTGTGLLLDWLDLWARVSPRVLRICAILQWQKLITNSSSSFGCSAILPS